MSLSVRVWTLIIVLSLVGVLAAVARVIYIDDLVQRAEPVRRQVLAALSITDPLAAERGTLLAEVDRRYADAPWATRVHVLAGALFLLLAPLQLAKQIRARHPRLHRWTGRALVIAGFASTIPGLYFGLVIPMAGRAESYVIALAGSLFLFALGKGILAARRKDFTLHREWMIRAFAAAIAISVIRVYALVLDLVLTPFGFTPQTIFVITLWLGWGTTLGAAELWLRRPALKRMVVAES